MNYLQKVQAFATISGRTPTIKKICLDMDGTIADLYNVPNWLGMLQAYDPSPYMFAQPMVNPTELATLLRIAIDRGIDVEIVTHLSKDSTPEFDTLVRETKKLWLDLFKLPYTSFHGLKYGSRKSDSIRRDMNWLECETAILLDDNEQVRKSWHMGETYDPAKENVCEILKKVLDIPTEQ